MMHGKINAAVKMLSNWSTCIRSVDGKVLKKLRNKHPDPSPIKEGTLLHGPINRVLRSYFDSIDEVMVLKAASLIKGAWRPPQLDFEQYQHILSSRKFKKENKELREQIARLARLLASEIVDPHSVKALVACRLIPLNKNPGVRPVGVGEVIRRITGKCIGWVMKKDIQGAAGPLQMATGLQSGAEAAIHSMKEIFDDEQTDAVILVDASNVFNSLNRNAALHNIQILCPQFSTILISTYRLPVIMIVFGSKNIIPNQGTTQDDNLPMSFYALGTATLLNYLLISFPNVKIVCLEDDITVAGTLVNFKKWWSTIISEGSKFGYYVNEDKRWLIVKNK